MFGKPPCPPKSVTERPVKIYRNVYHLQPVNIVQPVEIIYRHICCPVPRRVYQFRYRNEYENTND